MCLSEGEWKMNKKYAEVKEKHPRLHSFFNIGFQQKIITIQLNAEFIYWNCHNLNVVIKSKVNN